MGKRITVMKMLKKRLSDSIHIYNSAGVHKDMYMIYGHESDVQKMDNTRNTMLTDINQLNYLIKCLEEFKGCK